MAAYDWIEIDGMCPACSGVRGIRCQTHVASSYDGDETGRFFDRHYRLGERMAWWPGRDDGSKTHPIIASGEETGACEERCRSNCLACHSELSVLIRLRDLRAAEVGAITAGTE